MNICLLGVDGSGKTALGLMLKEYLESRGRKVRLLNVRGLIYALALPFIVLFLYLFYDDVICHRSYYDFIYRCLPEKIADKIIFLFPPVFTYKFFLYSDVKIIYDRKKEWPEEMLKQRQDMYKRVSGNHGFIEINTEIRKKESLVQMLSTIRVKSKI